MAFLSQAGGSNSSSSTTVVAGTLSQAPPQGSLIILSGMAGSNGSGTFTCPGFSAIPGLSTVATPTNGGFLFALYKLAGASESTSYTVTCDSANWMSAQTTVFTGRNAASIFTAVNSTTSTGSTSPLSVGVSGVTAAAGDDLFYIMGSNSNAALGSTSFKLTTAPSGFSNTLNTDLGSGFSPATCSCSKSNVSAGATGTVTGTVTWTGGGTADWGGFVISMAAAYVLVQSASASSFNSSVSSLSATFPKAVTAGNTLIAYTGCTDAANVAGTYTVSDNVNSGNYTADITNTGGGNFSLGIFRRSGTAAGTPTVTVQRATGAATGHIGLVVEEWSGIAPTSPLDQSISNNNAVINTTPTSANTGTYFETGELMLSCGIGANSLTWTAGTGFSMSPQTTGGLGGFLAAEYGVIPTTAATAATYTLSGSEFWQVVAAAYKPAQPNLGSQTVGVQVGTPGATVKYALTAQTVTSAEGTITPATALNLGSTSATFVEGQLLNQVLLGSQTATFTQGSITTMISGNVTLALSGLAGSFAEGILADNVGYILDNTIQGINIIGQTATFAEGTLQPGVIPQLTAQTITSTFQPPTFNAAYSLSAQTATFLEGFITSNLGNNVTQVLGKQSATFSQNPMSFVPSYGLTALTPTFTEGTLTFSATGDFIVSLSGQLATFAEGIIIQAFMGGMPNVVGIPIEEAELVLVQAGVLNPQILGYFGTYPLTFQWAQSTQAPGTVLAQSIPPGTVFTVNQPITLTISEFPLGVVSP